LDKREKKKKSTCLIEIGRGTETSAQIPWRDRRDEGEEKKASSFFVSGELHINLRYCSKKNCCTIESEVKRESLFRRKRGGKKGGEMFTMAADRKEMKRKKPKKIGLLHPQKGTAKMDFSFVKKKKGKEVGKGGEHVPIKTASKKGKRRAFYHREGKRKGKRGGENQLHCCGEKEIGGLPLSGKRRRREAANLYVGGRRRGKKGETSEISKNWSPCVSAISQTQHGGGGGERGRETAFRKNSGRGEGDVALQSDSRTKRVDSLPFNSGKEEGEKKKKEGKRKTHFLAQHSGGGDWKGFIIHS